MKSERWHVRSSPSCERRPSGLAGGRLRARPAAGREPKDYDVATDARPDQHHGLFPTPAGWARIRRRAGARQLSPGGGRDLPQRSRLRRRPPSRAACTSKPIRGRTCCAAISPSTPCCWIPISGERARLRRRPGRSARRHHPRHRRSRARFQEDHLRLLRAVRFAARLRFAIEPATFAAIRQLAPADPARFAPSGSATNWSAS